MSLPLFAATLWSNFSVIVSFRRAVMYRFSSWKTRPNIRYSGYTYAEIALEQISHCHTPAE